MECDADSMVVSIHHSSRILLFRDWRLVVVADCSLL